MQVVVLASGLAPSEVAESLVLIHGKPFVDWQLDRFVASGAKSVVMCVGRHGEEIETHVRRALDRGITVGYSYAGEQLVGSGGALRRAFARLEDEFVLTYGGRYLPIDYSAPLADLRAHPEATGTLCVGPDAGDVARDGDWVTRYDGPRGAGFADGGAIALRRAALAGVEDGAVWPVEALFRKLAREKKLRAFPLREPSLDVGSDGLARYLASSV